MKAYPAGAEYAQRLVASLKTMAMGDSNACEIAQESHLARAYESGLLQPETFLSPATLAPRGDVATGVIIDDCLTACKEKAMRSPLGRLRPVSNQSAVASCQQAVKGFHVGYLKHHLTRHEQKTVWQKYSVVACGGGGNINGKVGTANSPFGRILFLPGVTAEVASLGYASVELVMSLIGSWISAMLCRRRTLCLLETVHEALRGRAFDEVLRLSDRLRSELLSLVIVAPLLQADLRAAPSDRLWLVEASSRKLAVVSADLPCPLSKELGRFTLRKGALNRLLPPSMQWARRHDLLAEDEELPNGPDPATTGSRWIWEELVAGSSFRLDLVRRTCRLDHINVSELLSHSEAEHLATHDHRLSGAPRRGPQRPLLGTDSQVVAAAIAKGRSASTCLDGIMRTFLPNVLSQGLYTQPFWIGTKHNVADDPTRDVPVRAPSGPWPDWADDVMSNRFDIIDRRARDLICDPSVPELSDLATASEGRKLALDKKPESNKESEDHAPVAADAHGGIVDQELTAFRVEHQVLPSQPPPTAGASFTDNCDALLSFPRTAFMLPKGNDSESFRPTAPGALSLFAGSRLWEASMIARGCPWVLSIDFARHPELDLRRPDLRQKLDDLITRGAFKVVGGGPECASLSIAVTPPVRNNQFLAGRPDLLLPAKTRVRTGNLFTPWMADVYRKCVELDFAVWVENPDSSWLWRLRAWKRIKENKQNIFGEGRVDYCRFGAKRRKRTRFATNTSLRGGVRFCNGRHEHWRLRGSYGNTSRAKLAEPYPFPLCYTLAAACCKKAGWLPFVSRLNIIGCAKQTGPCIGEAMHPGPGAIRLLSFCDPLQPAPTCSCVYFSLDIRCVAPMPVALCGCQRPTTLRACDTPAALGAHIKPLLPMNRGGEPAFVGNALLLGFDFARASLAGSPVYLNCRAGQSISVCVAAHWYLGASNPASVLNKILHDNPSGSALLTSSLQNRRQALRGKSVLEAVLGHLDGSVGAKQKRDRLPPSPHRFRRQRSPSFFVPQQPAGRPNGSRFAAYKVDSQGRITSEEHVLRDKKTAKCVYHGYGWIPPSTPVPPLKQRRVSSTVEEGARASGEIVDQELTAFRVEHQVLPPASLLTQSQVDIVPGGLPYVAEAVRVSREPKAWQHLSRSLAYVLQGGARSAPISMRRVGTH